MPSRFRDIAVLERVLTDRLTQPLPGAAAQLGFAPQPVRKGWEPDQRPDHARRAAALILIYPGVDGLSFPLTERHGDLLRHAGQISLPGGGIDPGEAPESAALREAHEEIGVPSGDVRIVGALSTLWVIVSNFVVHPFVGVTDTRPDFRPAAREVETIIEAPLDQLLDQSRVQSARRTRDGVLVEYPYFDLAGHEVWGATAMMLGEFKAVLADHS